MTFSHPEKKTTRLLAATAAGFLALAGLAPAAHAESSFADQLKKVQAGSSSVNTDNPNLDRRDRTVLHYGVTTQEDIDKCTAEWAGKAYPAIDRGYDYPCPAAPITQADVDAAKAKAGTTGPLGSVEKLFSGLSS